MFGNSKEQLSTPQGIFFLIRSFGSESLVAHDYTEQSGSYMNGLWKKAFRALPRTFAPQHVLFLGVGLGGALQISAKRFSSAHITGVDWNPTLCALAQQRLHPAERFSVQCAEATHALPPQTELICGDLFDGKRIAPCMYNPVFLAALAQHPATLLINVYKDTEVLDALDALTPHRPKKRIMYYRSTIGFYGSPCLRA